MTEHPDHTRQTVAAAVAGNIRAYRRIRGLDQAGLARRLQSIGIAWRQGTVSDAENGQRSVTITEALGLTLALDVTVEQLLDSRGPEGWRGPSLVLTDETRVPAIPPASVTGLVCRHKAYAQTVWTDTNDFQGGSIETTEAAPL
jgi:transcriptional regulator with XRE-family HTH domain